MVTYKPFSKALLRIIVMVILSLVGPALLFSALSIGLLPGPLWLRNVIAPLEIFGGGGMLLLLLVCAPLGFLCLAYAAVRNDRRALAVGAVLLLNAAGGFVARDAARVAERASFNRLPGRAQPLIAAIEAYRQDNGVYPDTLQDLTSRYLGAIPTTGMVGWPDYRYRRDDGTEKADRGGYQLEVPVGRFPVPFDRIVYRPSGRYEDFSGCAVYRVSDWMFVSE